MRSLNDEAGTLMNSMRPVLMVCLVALLLTACDDKRTVAAAPDPEVCRTPPIGTFGYTHEMYLRDKGEYESCAKRHGVELLSSEWLDAPASDHTHTWLTTDIAVWNFQPGATEADVEKVLGAPMSRRDDRATGERFLTYGHTNATFRFAKDDKLIEFYGPTQTPTPPPAAKH